MTSATSLPTCPRCGSVIAGPHSCVQLHVTPSTAPQRSQGELLYERLYLEKWSELDDLKGRLEAMTGKRNKLATRVKRMTEALERIADESPHIENTSGVCPACMADVALGRTL